MKLIFTCKTLLIARTPSIKYIFVRKFCEVLLVHYGGMFFIKILLKVLSSIHLILPKVIIGRTPYLSNTTL